MPTAHHWYAVDFLDVIANFDSFDLIDDAAFFDALDEGKPSAVVGNGQTEGILILVDVNNFWLTSDVCENEIFKPDLSAEQSGHVNFVCVQRTEEYLKHEHFKYVQLLWWKNKDDRPQA